MEFLVDYPARAKPQVIHTPGGFSHDLQNQREHVSKHGALRVLDWNCWWLKSVDHLLRLVVFPIIYKVSYNPGGDRRISEPSTEVPIRNWHQHFSRTSISLLFPFLGESSISSPVSFRDFLGSIPLQNSTNPCHVKRHCSPTSTLNLP